MPAKSYHVVLGVSRDESLAGIRTAYHARVSHRHPDITGRADTPRFEEMSEAWPMGLEPISLFGQPEQTRPSFDAFRERYLRNFTGWNVPKAERAESLTLDVALSPAEALPRLHRPGGRAGFQRLSGVRRHGSGRPFPLYGVRRLGAAGGGGHAARTRAAPSGTRNGFGGAARNVWDQQPLSSGARVDFGRALSAPTAQKIRT